MLELVPLTAAFMLGCIVLIALSEDETLEERARREARPSPTRFAGHLPQGGGFWKGARRK